MAFCVFAAFILLAPMLPQALGLSSPFLRSWRMFADVGVGILKGSFRLEQPGGTPREISPLEMLGLQTYPRMHQYRFESRVRTIDDLKPLAGAFCRDLAPTARLSFEGAVGTRQGWRKLSVPDLCGGAHASSD